MIRFGTCKVRRLNQLVSTDLYLGRPAALFDRVCRIEWQKIVFSSYVEIFHYTLYGFVAHGMNYLLRSGSLTPCQSFARHCLLIFMISSVLIFHRNYLVF